MNKIILLMVISVLLGCILSHKFEETNILFLEENIGPIITAYALVTPNFIDEFDDEDPYTLNDGDISPNGKWQNSYNGYGSSGVEKDDDHNNVFFMYPKAAEKQNQTNANLVVTTSSFSDFEMSVDVKTEKQLRENDPPNPWEVAWIFFRYTDDFHYYWFTLKPNGIELGKKDCNNCTNTYQGQTFLVTDHEPRLEIGEWSKWKIKVVDNVITVKVNGHKVVDFIDVNMTKQLSSGKMGLYNEDAYAKFDDVKVKNY